MFTQGSESRLPRPRRGPERRLRWRSPDAGTTSGSPVRFADGFRRPLFGPGTLDQLRALARCLLDGASSRVTLSLSAGRGDSGPDRPCRRLYRSTKLFPKRKACARGSLLPPRDPERAGKEASMEEPRREEEAWPAGTTTLVGVPLESRLLSHARCHRVAIAPRPRGLTGVSCSLT